jgi:restriction system protein
MSTSTAWSLSASRFIGMERELGILLSEARQPGEARWLVLGARGIGKTRLAHEVSRHFGSRAAFLRLATRSSGTSANLAYQLSSLDTETPLIVLDDIDTYYLHEPASVLRALSRLPRATVLMTATRRQALSSWGPIAGPTTRTRRMSLKGLTDAESRTLLVEAGVEDKPLDGTVASAFEGALSAAKGNPRLLLEWAVLKREEGPALATILGSDGKPLPSGDERLVRVELAASGINDVLLAELTKRPHLMHALSPRQFEELVAELYERSGFEVELTQASRDGGVDLYAFQKAPFGSFLTIVDCKRYRSDRPVQVGLIRQLYGTVMDTDASVGVIATTSYFTQGAKSFQAERPHRLGLQDFVSLKDMLQQPPR